MLSYGVFRLYPVLNPIESLLYWSYSWLITKSWAAQCRWNSLCQARKTMGSVYIRFSIDPSFRKHCPLILIGFLLSFRHIDPLGEQIDFCFAENSCNGISINQYGIIKANQITQWPWDRQEDNSPAVRYIKEYSERIPAKGAKRYHQGNASFKQGILAFQKRSESRRSLFENDEKQHLQPLAQQCYEL